MGAALIIAWKDLRQRARDRSAFLIAIVLPFAMAVIFSLILSGVDLDEVAYRYALADEDNGLVARAFVEQTLLPLQDSGLIELEQADSREQAIESVDMGMVSAAFVIPEGFSSAVENAQPAQLEIVGAVDQKIAGLVANFIAEAFVQEVRVVQISVAAASTIGQGAAEPSRALVERASARPNPIVLADVSATKKELDAKTFFSAGMAVFFLFFTVQFGVSSIMDERRDRYSSPVAGRAGGGPLDHRGEAPDQSLPGNHQHGGAGRLHHQPSGGGLGRSIRRGATDHRRSAGRDRRHGPSGHPGPDG